MPDGADMPASLRDALEARRQTIRGTHAWVAQDFPAEEAVGMTAALLDTDAAEVAAALQDTEANGE